HGHRANALILELAAQPLDVEDAAVARDLTKLDTAPRGELHPRVHVRRKLHRRREYDVALLQRQRECGEVDSKCRIGRQRDLARRGADQLRDQLTSARERAELELLRNALRVRAQSRPLVGRGDCARRKRTSRRVVQVDRFARVRPGEFGAAQRLDVVAHGREMSGKPAPRGMAARTARGSIASRSASPSRLNPSTAAPIASPGNTDVHGACRSWYKSRPSAIIEPQLGVGGWTPRPRNDSDDSAMMAPATPSVAAMTTGATTLGKIWLMSILTSPLPNARSACTNSSSRTTST